MTMKNCILVLGSALLMVSCAQNAEPPAQSSSQGIMPKPESNEMRPGDKVNMMMLMDASSRYEELDEVIVIPPKEKKKAAQ